MTDISLRTPHHELKAYVSVPAGTGPWPGVVVVHDAGGLSPDTRRQADWLAGAGFVAIAPDLFSWGKKRACTRAVFADMRAGTGPSLDDIEAARAWLQGRPDCTGKIGVVGFCMGGAFALYAAVGRDFSVSSVNYGNLPRDVDSVVKGACPIVGSFGAKDWIVKDGAGRVRRALEKAGVKHDVKEYPVGHSFMNQHSGVLGAVGPLMGMRYDAPSEADARRRIEAFFHAQLD